MGWDDLIHPFLCFLMIFLKRVHREFGGSFSLVCSPKELGEGQGDGNGSIGRGKLGRLHSWRDHGVLGTILFVVITLAWRRVLSFNLLLGFFSIY
jgi:hypothetical protein